MRRRNIYSGLATLLLLAAATWLLAAPAAVDAAVPASEDAKAIAAVYFEQVMSDNDSTAADAVLASKFERIDRALPKAVLGKAGTQFMASYLHKAFPDLRYHVDAIVLEGNEIAVCWTATGTFAGEFRGLPATGKPVTWTGMSFLALKDGKLVQEMTNMEDLAAVLGMHEGVRLSPSYAQ